MAFDYTQLFNGIDTGLGLIGDMINTGFNIWNAVDQNKQNKWSRDFAQQQFDYQKGLNEKLFEREDNAVQRRAADLQKAGLSKTLAAGGAAQSSVAGISPTNAPQSNTNFMDKAIFKTNLLNNKLNIQRTNADNELKGHEGRLFNEKIDTEKSLQDMYGSQKNYYEQEARRLKHDNDVNEETGNRSNDNNHPLFNTAKSVIEYFTRLHNNWTDSTIKNAWDSLDSESKGLFDYDFSKF